MILPRLKPSAVLPLAKSLTISSSRYANQGNKALFFEINRLARQGKWDAINNSPKLLQINGKKEADAVYAKLIQPEDPFYKYGGQPYGPFIYLITGLAKFTTIAFVLIKGYEIIVPEQYRLHYKYRPRHHDEEHH